MVKIFNIFNIIIFHIIIKNFIFLKYCGIGESPYNVKTPPINNNNIKTNLEPNDFRPIKIYLETSYIEYYKGFISDRYNLILEALNSAKNYLEKIIKVKPLSYTISIRNSDIELWDIKIKDELNENNGIDQDLAIIIKVGIFPFEASSEIKYIDQETKRPIVGIINLDMNIETNLEMNYVIQYLKTLFLHQFTHILGFYNELYPNFIYANGDISKVIKNTASDQRSGVKRSY